MLDILTTILRIITIILLTMIMTFLIINNRRTRLERLEIEKLNLRADKIELMIELQQLRE